jgi:hypothetical protein
MTVHSWWSELPDVDKGIVATLTVVFMGWVWWLIGRVPIVFRWWRLRRLRRLAKSLREYAGLISSLVAGEAVFERRMFTTQLEGKLPFYFFVSEEDVIEYMEEKGWAKKTGRGDWHIS